MAFPDIPMPVSIFSVPSTGKRYQFRPFTLAEEKVILLADKGDDRDRLNAVATVIRDCCTNDNKIEPLNLTLQDCEFLFIKLRSISVSDTVPIKIGKEEYVINLNDVKIKQPHKVNDTVKLTDKVGVKLKWPTLGDLIKLDMNDRAVVIAACIKAIYNGDQLSTPADWNAAEVNEFVTHKLTLKAIGEIYAWYESAPFAYVDVLTSHGVRTIKGFQNFFGSSLATTT